MKMKTRGTNNNNNNNNNDNNNNDNNKYWRKIIQWYLEMIAVTNT